MYSDNPAAWNRNAPSPATASASASATGTGDRRADGVNRLVTTLLIGRLVSAHGDIVCRVRNISEHGARIESALPLVRGDRVQLELRGNELLDAEVAWSEDGATGLRFAEPVPAELILRPVAAQQGWHSRLPRLDAECSVTVIQDGRRIAATLRDINQRGMRVDGLGRQLPQGTLTVQVPGLGSLPAATRWQREDAAGLQFLNPVRFETLSAWLVDPASRFGRRAEPGSA